VRSGVILCWGSRWPVLYKFVDDQGSYLAAQITYYGFLSLFPLLLLLTSVLGLKLSPGMLDGVVPPPWK